MNNGYGSSSLPALKHVKKKKKKQMDIQINITCKLSDIAYHNDNHLCLQWTDNGLQLTCKLIANYNDIIHKSQYKLTESDENINHDIFDTICISNNSIHDKIISDLKQYQFITIALNPTPPPSPILPMNNKINGNINNKINEKNGEIHRKTSTPPLTNPSLPNLNPPPNSINNIAMKPMKSIEPMESMKRIRNM